MSYFAPTSSESPFPLPISFIERLDCVFIEDITLDLIIGIYGFEKHIKQQVIISVWNYFNPQKRTSSNYICYHSLLTEITNEACKEPFEFVEDLAEVIANLCLSHPLCEHVKIRIIKKTEACLENQVGVIIQRDQRPRSTH